MIPSISPYFEELIRGLKKLALQHTASEAKKLLPLSQDATKQLFTAFYQKKGNFDQTIQKLIQNVQQLCNRAKHYEIKIEVEGKEISLAQSSSTPKLIPGKVHFRHLDTFQRMTVDCYVSFGQWSRLGKLQEGKINILDHLNVLLPKLQNTHTKRPIGLVTFQNGIMNNFKEDFYEMSQGIVNQFPEGPLCIGLHNPTTHILPLDMYRFRNEPSLNANAVYSLLLMIKVFADRISEINPNIIWTHFAHSEGGLILNAVMKFIHEQRQHNETKKFIKKNFVAATYGAVKPLSSDYVLDAINTYSNRDIALFFGKNYLPKHLKGVAEGTFSHSHEGKSYSITIVNSKTPEKQLLRFEKPEILTLEERLNLTWLESIARMEELNDGSTHLSYALIEKVNKTAFEIDDHGFMQDTYRAVLESNIYEFKKEYKVYAPKNSL